MGDKKLQHFWKVMDEVMFFPKFIIIGIPSLVFISFFFIPEGYTGLTETTQNIQATYQNRWAFDVINLSILILFVYIHINAFFNKNFCKNKYKLVQYFDIQKNINPENEMVIEHQKVLRPLFYFFSILFIYMMNSGGFNDNNRWTTSLTGPVFYNFFLFIPLFYFTILFLGLVSFLTKGDYAKGLEIFSEEKNNE